MNKQEAFEWIKGTRSTTNMVPQEPRETWLVRTAQADAAMVQLAYWVLKAHHDKLMEDE